MSLSPGCAWGRRVRSTGFLALLCGVLPNTSFAQDLVAASDWSSVADQSASHTGAVLATGDINNDGFADVVVSAPAYDGASSADAGAVHIFYGAATGLPSQPDLTLVGTEAGAQFGSALAVGDVNNDGFADVAVGAPYADNLSDSLQPLFSAGAVSLYLGSATGLAATPVWNVVGDRAASLFGTSVAVARDISGDGFGDVVVGATYRSDDRDTASVLNSAGAVFVYNGTATVPALAPAWVAYGTQIAAFFGNSVATGDFNNDGFSDVVVSAFAQENTADAGNVLWDAGAVLVFAGSATGLPTAPSATVIGAQDHGYFGDRVASAGDVDNDGFVDLLVSAPYHDNDEFPQNVRTNAGAVFLFKGSAAGVVSAAPAWVAHGAQAYAYFGASIAGAGDLNGDGFADIAIGAPGYDNNEIASTMLFEAGRVVAYYGSAAGLGATPAWSANGGAASENFGSAVAVSGDVSNDGFGDLLAGAENHAGAGAVFAFLGSVSGANTPPQVSAIADVSITQDTATAALPFTIGDVETAAASLTLSATSSNTTLVPNANIVLGGAGASRTVTVTPVVGQTGVAIVLVAVGDGKFTTTTSFALTVKSPNVAPTITAIPDQIVARAAATPALGFTIADVDNAVADLTLSVASSNISLVPLANIVIGGREASRSVTVTPVADSSGVATIGITVSDGVLTSTAEFTVTINTPPTISAVADVAVGTGVSTGDLNFTVGDTVTAATDLVVTARSSNTAVIPNSNITLSGSGASRSVSVLAGATGGSAVITLNVSDGLDVVTAQFTVSVNAPPVISAIPSQTVMTGVSTGAISFTIFDTESPVSALLLSASSNNESLVATADVVLGGAGASRTVTVTPQPAQTGGATITVTVSDGTHAVSASFVVTVTAVNTAPSISSIANQSLVNGAASAALGFTVADAESVASGLNVSVASSNTVLAPTAKIVLGGSGTNRTITVTPVTGQSGSAVITITVSDGALSASTSFAITVSTAVSGGSSGGSGGTSGSGSKSKPAPKAKSSGGGSLGLPLILVLGLWSIARRRG